MKPHLTKDDLNRVLAYYNKAKLRWIGGDQPQNFRKINRFEEEVLARYHETSPTTPN